MMLKYRGKYNKLKTQIKTLVFENALLCDEVAAVQGEVTKAHEDRQYLMGRLMRHEDVEPVQQEQAELENMRTTDAANPNNSQIPKKAERENMGTTDATKPKIFIIPKEEERENMRTTDAMKPKIFIIPKEEERENMRTTDAMKPKIFIIPKTEERENMRTTDAAKPKIFIIPKEGENMRRTDAAKPKIFIIPKAEERENMRTTDATKPKIFIIPKEEERKNMRTTDAAKPKIFIIPKEEEGENMRTTDAAKPKIFIIPKEEEGENMRTTDAAKSKIFLIPKAEERENMRTTDAAKPKIFITPKEKERENMGATDAAKPKIFIIPKEEERENMCTIDAAKPKSSKIPKKAERENMGTTDATKPKNSKIPKKAEQENMRTTDATKPDIFKIPKKRAPRKVVPKTSLKEIPKVAKPRTKTLPHKTKRDASGNPIYPLHLNTTLMLHVQGEIISENYRFHNENWIYPVGYITTRIYANLKDPRRRSVYTCKIINNAGRPQFQIIPDNNFKGVIFGESPNHCHTVLLNKIRGFLPTIAAQLLLITQGERFFGLANPTVMSLIKADPNFHCCTRFRGFLEAAHYAQDEQDPTLCFEALQSLFAIPDYHIVPVVNDEPPDELLE